MGTTRRSFSQEFRVEAVRMATEGGHSLAQVAHLSIRPDMLRRWRRQFNKQDPEQAFPGLGQRKARDEEMWQLRRKLDDLTPEEIYTENRVARRLGLRPTSSQPEAA